MDYFRKSKINKCGFMGWMLMGGLVGFSCFVGILMFEWFDEVILYFYVYLYINFN